MDPTVHNRVRQLRQARNWTQEQLATEARVSRQSMNSIERGRYVPSLPLALVLAQVFATPVEQLFSLSPFPETNPETETPSNGSNAETAGATSSPEPNQETRS